MRNFYHFAPLWAAVAIIMLYDTSYADELAEVESFARALQDRDEHFHWKFVFHQVDFDAATKGEFTSITDLELTGSVRCDFRNSRSHLLVSGKTTWHNGAAEYVSYIRGFSSANGQHRGWVKYRQGLTIPESGNPTDPTESYTTGFISTENPEYNTMQTMLLKSGIEYLPVFQRAEYSSEIQKRSDFLMSLDRSKITTSKTSDGKISIEIPIPSSPFVKGSDHTEYALYTFDSSQGYALTEIKGYYGNSEKKTLYKETQIENIKWSDSIWAPSTVILLNYHARLAAVIRLSDQSVSADVPEDFYDLKFPEGTEVDDFINKMAYTVSESPVSDADKVKRFIERHIKEYPDFSATDIRDSRNHYYIWIVVANVMLLTVIGTLWTRRWFKRNAKAIAFVAILVVSRNTCAGDFTWDNGWKTKFVNGIKVVQCGFSSTVFVLEMMGIDYHPYNISRLLEPTEAGTSAYNIKRALSLHGVKVDAYKNVTVRTLPGLLRDGRIAVVPVELSNKSVHYCCIYLGKDSKNIVIVDPFYETVESTQLDGIRFVSGICLVCELCTTNPDHSKIFPTSVSTGRLTPSLKSPIVSSDFTLSNSLSDDLVINEVVASCGCVQIEPLHLILSPGEKYNVRYSIDTRRASVGSNQVTITALTPQGKIALGLIRFDIAFSSSSVDHEKRGKVALVVDPRLVAFDGCYRLTGELTGVRPFCAVPKVVGQLRFVEDVAISQHGRQAFLIDASLKLEQMDVKKLCTDGILADTLILECEGAEQRVANLMIILQKPLQLVDRVFRAANQVVIPYTLKSNRSIQSVTIVGNGLEGTVISNRPETSEFVVEIGEADMRRRAFEIHVQENGSSLTYFYHFFLISK